MYITILYSNLSNDSELTHCNFEFVFFFDATLRAVALFRYNIQTAGGYLKTGVVDF